LAEQVRKGLVQRCKQALAISRQCGAYIDVFCFVRRVCDSDEHVLYLSLPTQHVPQFAREPAALNSVRAFPPRLCMPNFHHQTLKVLRGG
jgi:hypothetical protein